MMADTENNISESRIYRYKVQNAELFSEMKEFAASHKYESKEILKESFETWYQSGEISALIESEENYLTRCHYDFNHNNMKSKIFKSIKYYFIKNMLKSMNLGEGIDQKNKNKQKSSTSFKFSKSFIESAKNHLKSSIYNNDFKPNTSFQEFLTQYNDIIQSEKTRLDGLNHTHATEFDAKLKKMYKNQYYVLHTNMSNEVK